MSPSPQLPPDAEACRDRLRELLAELFSPREAAAILRGATTESFETKELA